MADDAVSPDSPSSANFPALSPRKRLAALGIVLLVSFSTFVATSSRHFFGQPMSIVHPSQFPLLLTLIDQMTSLLLLWFVLAGQGRSWGDIGWNLRWRDVLDGVGLIIVVRGAAFVFNFAFQIIYHKYTGHYLQPRSIHSVFDLEISALSIAVTVVNPFFEELIVRAFTMSELTAVGVSKAVTILLSVLIQMSYHTYQGLLRGIGLATTFALYSLYFSKKRRIAPVIVAHFYSDAAALIRHNF